MFISKLSNNLSNLNNLLISNQIIRLIIALKDDQAMLGTLCRLLFMDHTYLQLPAVCYNIIIKSKLL